MKISLVTLSFNQGPYLQQALASVFAQEGVELEYIVVDPGSTDGSRELIEAHRCRLARMLFEPDKGAADGLNKGFREASGEIFGFLNADDVLMPGALARVAAYAGQHPECGLILGDGHILDGTGRRVRRVKARGFTLRRYLYGGTQWLQQSTFFRREAFAASGGFNPENRTSWDGELFVKMATQGVRAGYIGADLAGFRIHAQSISGSGANGRDFERDWRRIFSEVAGRPWRFFDELLRTIYRAEGLLLRAGAWLQDLAGRGGE